MRAETLHRNVHRGENRPWDEPPCEACVQRAKEYPPAPKLRTRTVAGLEFEVSVWDPAPTPWYESGSWVQEPETSARIEAGLVEALGGEDAVRAMREEALAAGRAVGGEACRTYWGSHGCDREAGHEGLCVCGAGDPDGPCSAIHKLDGAPPDWSGGDSGHAIAFWDEELRISTLSWVWFE